MEINKEVSTFSLSYEMFDGPNTLSVHVIDTPDATVLFGSGHESTTDEVTQIAADHGVDIVVPEHGDGDHYGGIPALQDTITDLQVAVPAGDADWIRDAGINPDRELHDGDMYWGIEAIAAPGHTPGNMAFRYGDVLIAGDTLVGTDFEPISGDPWSGAFGIVPPSRNTGGDAEAQASVRKLLDYDFEMALVSHGANVYENAQAEVRTLVEDLDAGIERTEF